MVHKNNKWNLSINKGESIIHDTLQNILTNSENNMIKINELIVLMNQQTKHIKFITNHKKKPLSTYIRCIYGSLIAFIDKYIIYALLEKDNNTYVKLIENQSDYTDSRVEGIYIKTFEDKYVKYRCKLVRNDFICGNEHWTKGGIQKNNLKY